MAASITRVFGLLHRDGREVSRAQLDAMAAAMRAGAATPAASMPSVLIEGAVGLGTVRIGDTRTAPAPYTHAESGVIVAGDLHLYDRAGAATDGSFLADRYLRDGDAFAARVRGDFAAAVWDPRSQMLLFARDHLGCAPLFYACTERLVAFASHITGVVAALASDPALDPEWVASLLVADQADVERTAYRDIRRAIPAHVYRLTRQGLTRRRYWDLDNACETWLASDADYERALREHIEDAVRVRLAGGVMGSELSGGLDSSTVTALAFAAARETGRPYHALSHVIPEDALGVVWPWTDERDWASRLTRHAHIDNHVHVTHGTDSLVGGLARLVKLYGAPPTCNYAAASAPLYAHASVLGVETLFTGFGGDQMVSGSATRATAGAASRIGRWRRRARSWLPGRGSSLRVHGEKRARSIVAALPLRPGWADAWSLVSRAAQVWEAPAAAVTVRDYERHAVQQPGIAERLESYSLAAGAWGIACRHPLLDVSLLEFFHGIPESQKRRAGVGRHLFRRAIKDIVPEEIRWRPAKQSATIPGGIARFRGAEASIRALLARTRDCSELEFIDFAKMDAWVDAIMRTSAGNDGLTAVDLRAGRFNAVLSILVYHDLRSSGWLPAGSSLDVRSRGSYLDPDPRRLS